METEIAMVEEKAPEAADELKAWYKPLLDATVNRLIKAGVVTGAAVEAAPMWAEPNRVLIAKVWGTGQRGQFFWAITGEDYISDHVPGSMANTPQEVARHFSLKWQMDAERLLAMANKQGTTEKTARHLQVHREKLIRQAEHLHDLSRLDEIWKLPV
jgi:hypothetical protein